MYSTQWHVNEFLVENLFALNDATITRTLDYQLKNWMRIIVYTIVFNCCFSRFYWSKPQNIAHSFVENWPQKYSKTENNMETAKMCSICFSLNNHFGKQSRRFFLLRFVFQFSLVLWILVIPIWLYMCFFCYKIRDVRNGSELKVV